MSKLFGGLFEWWGWWKEKEDRILLGKLLPSGLFCLLEEAGAGGGGGGGIWEKKNGAGNPAW